MNEPKPITTWCGRDIRELSREELCEALEDLSQAYMRAEARASQLEREQIADMLRKVPK